MSENSTTYSIAEKRMILEDLGSALRGELKFIANLGRWSTPNFPITRAQLLRGYLVGLSKRAPNNGLSKNEIDKCRVHATNLLACEEQK